MLELLPGIAVACGGEGGREGGREGGMSMLVWPSGVSLAAPPPPPLSYPLSPSGPPSTVTPWLLLLLLRLLRL